MTCWNLKNSQRASRRIYFCDLFIFLDWNSLNSWSFYKPMTELASRWGKKWKTTSIELTWKLFWTLRAKPVWDIKCLTLCSTETTFSSSKAKVIQSSRQIKFRARLARQNGVDGWKLFGPQPGEYIWRHFLGYFRCGLVGQKFLWAEV